MSRVHNGEPSVKRCGVIKGNENVGDGSNLDANVQQYRYRKWPNLNFKKFRKRKRSRSKKFKTS